MKDKVYPIFNTDLSCKDLIFKPEVFKNNYLIDRLFEDSKNKQLNEEENLAYVACTRAKDILIINGFASKKATWFSDLFIFLIIFFLEFRNPKLVFHRLKKLMV